MTEKINDIPIIERIKRMRKEKRKEQIKGVLYLLPMLLTVLLIFVYFLYQALVLSDIRATAILLYFIGMIFVIFLLTTFWFGLRKLNNI